MLRNILSPYVHEQFRFCHESLACDLEDEVNLCFRENRKIFNCPQCHYITDRKNNLKRHIITMHQESKRNLECCGISFHSKAIMREHVSLFHRNGYSCQICSRNFCRKALLRRHLAVHSGRKDYLCGFCDYATSHKSNLERHQKIHLKKAFRQQQLFHEDFTKKDDSVFLEINSSDFGLSDFIESHVTVPTYKKKRTNRRRYLLTGRLEATYRAEEHDMLEISEETESKHNENEDFEINNNLPPNEMILNKSLLRMLCCDNKRLCSKPYKCSECNGLFSTQIDHAGHRCPVENNHVGCPVTALFLKMSVILDSKEKKLKALENDINMLTEQLLKSDGKLEPDESVQNDQGI